MALVAEDIRSSLFDQFDLKMREMEQEADTRVLQAVGYYGLTVLPSLEVLL